MLRWSIASVCMGGALEEKFAAAAKAGFRAVEIFENDLTFFRGKPRDARLLAADLGLEIVALQPLRDFEAMPDPARAKNFDRAARKLDLMHELGARLLCLCSNVSPDAIDDESAPPGTSLSSPISPASTACGSATRRWPGGGG